MARNRPVETSQPVKQDNRLKQTELFSCNFPTGSTKIVCSIYFLSAELQNFCVNGKQPCDKSGFPVKLVTSCE